VNDLLRLLTLQDANTRTVLLGTMLLGLVAGVVGSFAVLRRRALLGDALAHASLPGIAVAFFVVGDRSTPAFLAGALTFGLLGVGVVALLRAYTRVRDDAAIGLVLSVFFGLGIVLSRIIQNRPTGNRAGLDGFILGKAASMVHSDIVAIAWVAGVSLVLVALLYKELLALCFDRDFAKSLGRPVVVLDALLMGLLALVVVAALPAVGVVMAAAMLIIPPAAARFWTDRLWLVLILAGVFGAASAMLGTGLSAVLPGPSMSNEAAGSINQSRGLPTGPLIILAASSVFILSTLFAPARGVLAGAIRRVRTRRELAGPQELPA
jgi:manganese/zinc/iron transport system permease protein